MTETRVNGTVITSSITDAIRYINQISLTAKSAAHAKRLKGMRVWLPPLAYSRSYEEYRWGFGYQVYPDPVFGWVRQGNWYGLIAQPPDPVPSAFKSALQQRAEARCLDKLKNQQVNFATFFAEAGQTCSMVGSTAKTLASAVLKVKSGNVAGALKALKPDLNARDLRRATARVKAGAKLRNQAQITRGGAVDVAANRWLEMQFGWGPLLSDMDGAARLLAERSTADKNRARFSVRSQVKEKLDKEEYFKSSSTSEIWKTKGFALCMVRVDFRFTNPALASITADGLTNPAALLWEETPFSFLADYALGLGAWLNRLDATLGKEFIGGTITQYEKWSREGSANFGGQTYGQMKYTRKRMRMVRSVMSGFTDASLIALKVQNPINSVRRLGNGISLLVQACKKR